MQEYIERSVFIAYKIKSQNFSQGHHWAGRYRKYKQDWLLLITSIFGQGHHHEKPRTIRLTVRHDSKRKLIKDYGNLVGGAKPVPDCLTKLGWLKDDSMQWFWCDYRQEVCTGKEEGTRIDLFKQSLPFPLFKLIYCI